MENYLYKKQFAIRTNETLLLLNQEKAKEYSNNKVKLLLSAENKEKIILTILKEFEEIYHYDLETAEITFEIEEEVRKIEILKEDIRLYLGDIFSNYHIELLKNNKGIRIIDFRKFVIDYNELYDEALTDYLRVLTKQDYIDIFKLKEMRKKNTNKIEQINLFPMEDAIYERKEYRGVLAPFPVPIPEHLKPNIKEKSYLASYSFSAMIDYLLILKIVSFYVRLGVKKIEEEKIKLTKNEQQMIDILKLDNVRIEKYGEKDWYGFIKKIFKKRDIFKDENIYKIIEKKTSLTIGQIISADYEVTMKSIIKEEYYQLMVELFDIHHLNIRNDIMHLNDANEDYFSIEFAAILLELLWIISSNKIFKEEELAKIM